VRRIRVVRILGEPRVTGAIHREDKSRGNTNTTAKTTTVVAAIGKGDGKNHNSHNSIATTATTTTTTTKSNTTRSEEGNKNGDKDDLPPLGEGNGEDATETNNKEDNANGTVVVPKPSQRHWNTNTSTSTTTGNSKSMDDAIVCYYYPVRATFCTPEFRLKSYVIAVIPGNSTSNNSNNHNGESNAGGERRPIENEIDDSNSGSSDTVSNDNANGKAILSVSSSPSSSSSLSFPYFNAVERALQMYRFPKENVTRVVIRGCCTSNNSSSSSQDVLPSGGGSGDEKSDEQKQAGFVLHSAPPPPPVSECICLLERLDRIVVKALCVSLKATPYIGKGMHMSIRELLFGSGVSSDNNNRASNRVTNSLVGKTTTTILAFERLSAFWSSEGEIEEEEQGQQLFRRTVLDTMKPFRDATQVLSEEMYPTVGLAISILRRIRYALLQQQQKQLDNDQIRTTAAAGTTTTNSGDDDDDESSDGKLFYKTIYEEFTKTFSSVLSTNPPFVWTMPLDPRLIAMRGISKEEQRDAKSVLIEEVAKVVRVIDQKEKELRRQNTTMRRTMAGASDYSKDNNSNNYRYSSAATTTMAGIFWGEEETNHNPPDDRTDSNTSITTTGIIRNAGEYAKKNVDSYFNTIQSQRQIKDPLLWWRNNQNQFPELSMLARKWICSSTVYGRPDSRDNECTNLIPTISYCSNLDTETISRMIFLHDNNDLI